MTYTVACSAGGLESCKPSKHLVLAGLAAGKAGRQTGEGMNLEGLCPPDLHTA
jgi:hypothetical protein